MIPSPSSPRHDDRYPNNLRDPATRYKAILDVNNAIINQTNCETFFRKMAKEIRKIIHYDRFSISIYELDSHVLSWFAMADGMAIPEIDGGPRLLDKNSIAGTVVISRKPLLIKDISHYAHWPTVRLLKNAGIQSAIGIPLIVRDIAIGSLNFCFKNPPAIMEELKSFLVDLSLQIAISVDNLLSHNRLARLNESLEEQKNYLLGQVYKKYSPDKFYYQSSSMQKIMQQVELIADSEASVLITGETGTGKDHIARHIHNLSNRRNALFVKVNCPALVPSLFESELFGHAKGAFTGADSKRIGRFEMARGGTIFLDEIGELPLYLQTKLLHVLEDRQFERVGENKPLMADFRVVAATNTNLQEAISKEEFRSDLYYRINTISLHIPPMSERVEDIELILQHFTQDQAANMNRPPPIYSSEVIDILKQYSWPGNVREIENIVSRLIILFSGKKITPRDIKPLLDNINEKEASTPVTLSELERTHLIKILSITKGVVGGKKGAEAILKIPKSTIQYKLRIHGLNPSDFR